MRKVCINQPEIMFVMTLCLPTLVFFAWQNFINSLQHQIANVQVDCPNSTNNITEIVTSQEKGILILMMWD